MDLTSTSIVDVIACTNGGGCSGFSDAPPFPSAALGEFYVFTVEFPNNMCVTVDYRQDNASSLNGSALGNARMVFTVKNLLTSASITHTFGALVSTATGGVGNSPPLGFDAVVAITNVNANVPLCDRLHQTIVVHAGSDLDCSGNGEPTVIMTCDYALTQGIRVTKQCPPTNAVPGSRLVFSGSVTNTGQAPLTNITVLNNRPAPNTVVTNFALLNVGQALSFTGSYIAPTNFCAITDTLTVFATNSCTFGQVSNTASATCTINNTPRLQLTKLCPPTNAVPGRPLIFTGTVTNSGNIAITNIVIVNNQPAAGTAVTNFARLEPGEGRAFTGSYLTPTNVCAVTDTLTATGRDLCNTAVSTNISVTCAITNTSRLQLTRICPPTNAVPGSLFIFTGTVTNTGNTAITNIVIVNSQPTNNTPVTTIARLESGEGRAFSGSYITPTNVCAITDTLTATGRDLCNTPVSSNVSATCAITNTSRLQLTKICPPTNAVPGTPLIFSGTVTNTGNMAITNIVIVNNQPAAGTAVTNFARLEPGEGRAFTGSYLTPTNVCAVTDTLTATGRDLCNTAVSTNISATCAITVTPRLQLTRICPPTNAAPGSLLIFTGTVTNTGNMAITNIVIVNSQPTNNSPVTVIARLEPGQGRTFTGSYLVPIDVCSVSVTLRATGRDVCSFLVETNVSATCAITNIPRLQLTTTCPMSAVATGELMTITGTVTNTGNTTLDNVTVTNFVPAIGRQTIVVGPVSLAPGQGTNFSDTFNVATNCVIVDRVVASGVERCFGRIASASIEAPCPLECEPCPTNVFLVCGARSDPTFRAEDKPPDRNQAIWIRAISTNLVFDPPGQWIENPDGTAVLTGTNVSLTNLTSGFYVTVNLRGRTTTAPAGSPFFELDPRAYIYNDGPIDPSTWYYYPEFTGTLTGFGIWEGAVVNVTRYGPAWQVGVGANGKNLDFGASAWFTWTVVSHPSANRFPENTGQGDFNLDFKVCPPSEIGDFVWEDLNQNGLQDDGATGVPGVEVQLWDCTGTRLAITNTDANGYYLFTNKPGIYVITFVLPTDFSFTTPDAGSNDAIDSDASPENGRSPCVTLGVAESNRTIDAGLVRACPTLVFGAISDPAYRPEDKPPDRNQAIWIRAISTNLIFAASEPGRFIEFPDGTAQLTGTTRSLTNLSSGFIVNVSLSGRRTTPPAGSPFFELDPSAYNQNGGPIDPSTWYYYASFTGTLTGFGIWESAVIRVTRYGPAFQVGAGANGKNLSWGASAWFSWTVLEQPNAGPFPENSGQGDFNLDLIVCPVSEIGNFVWEDLNRNGVQDAAEPGVPNVEVRLANCTGQLLAVTNTDANGLYVFTNAPGIYNVTFVLPSGFTFTTANAGNDDTRDSDANSAGVTPCFTLLPAQINDTIDAGLIRVCPMQVLGAISDPTYRPADKPPDRNQAIWIRPISTNLIFAASEPGQFVEFADGTARFTGTTRSLTNMGSGFIVNVTFSGRRTTPPSGSPLLELDPRAYVDRGGPIDPATWYYYTAFDGTLTGFGIWEGAVVRVVRYGPAFQVGVGANGKNQTFGASGWFTFTVLDHPDAGDFPDDSGQGDFNLDLIPCPTPPAPAPVLAGFEFTAADRCQLRFQGEVGRTYRIEGSADLIHWRMVTTVRNETGVLQFTDPGAGNRCFYRLIVVEP